MKYLCHLIAIVSLIIGGCNHNHQADKSTVAHIPDHFKPGKYCYKALFEKDSASLNFEIAHDGKITGLLNVQYYNADSVTYQREPTAGRFTGEFRGDTLFADYYFTSGTNGKEQYINPIALLCKNDTLIMGHGKIYYYLGRTYFDDKTPIDYKKSRFRFIPADCKK